MLITGPDENNNPQEAKVLANALQVINKVAGAVEEGSMFDTSKMFLAVAAAGTGQIHLVTTTKNAYAVITISGTAKCTAQVYLGSTYSNAGTVLNIVNNNAQSIGSTTLAAFHTPTVNALGTSIFEEVLPGNTVPVPLGVNCGERANKVIPINSDALVVITNTSAAAADYSVAIDWYEI